jgi:chemotaxis protein methyltransferase CheR
MDIIFCRNVLMYFGRSQIKQVVARFRDCLVDGGWLVVNASEASAELFPGFTPVVHGDAVYFRKGAMPAAAAPQMPARRAARIPAPVRAGQGARPAPTPAPACAPQPRDELMARVRMLAEAGAREEALQCLRRAVEAEPLSAPLHRSAALFALEHGDQAMARLGVRRLLYLDPDSAIGLYLSAMIEDAAGREPRVLRLLRDCRRLAAADGADEGLIDAVDMWLERLQ